MSINNFQNRIEYQGDLKPLLEKVCFDYGFGNYLAHKIAMNGYEDFNIVLETDKGKYFVKIFAKFRNEKEYGRYINIVEKVLEAGVRHPLLYSSNYGRLYKTIIDDVAIALCVLEYIDGNALYEGDQSLGIDEMKFIVEQASIINGLEIEPANFYDSWAIVNLLKEYEKKGKYLEKADINLIEVVAKDFAKININHLPHCFVHGDIIKTNVMKNKQGDLYIIDFSVSNHYPRIQELAVMLCSLFFDTTRPDKNEKNYKLVVEEYNKYIQLTDIELETLPLYLKAAHAMHLLSANHEAKVFDNQTAENIYWIEHGRKGIQSFL